MCAYASTKHLGIAQAAKRPNLVIPRRDIPGGTSALCRTQEGKLNLAAAPRKAGTKDMHGKRADTVLVRSILKAARINDFNLVCSIRRHACSCHTRHQHLVTRIKQTTMEVTQTVRERCALEIRARNDTNERKAAFRKRSCSQTQTAQKRN